MDYIITSSRISLVQRKDADNLTSLLYQILQIIKSGFEKSRDV